jgi:hypothetical protein
MGLSNIFVIVKILSSMWVFGCVYLWKSILSRHSRKKWIWKGKQKWERMRQYYKKKEGAIVWKMLGMGNTHKKNNKKSHGLCLKS